MSLTRLAESLTKASMGAGRSPGEQKKIIFALEDYQRSQTRKCYILIAILVLLLIIPVVTTQLNMRAELYRAFVGGAGLFSVGIFTLVVRAFQDLSRSQTLVILCKGLESADAKDVILAWLKGKS